MRFTTVARIGLAVALGAAAPSHISARELATPGGHHVSQYRVIIYGNLLSGGQGFSNSINNRGWVAGYADVSSTLDHATVWQTQNPTDLGTLGGPNSGIDWPNKSNRRMAKRTRLL